MIDDLPPITLPAEFVIPAWRNAYLLPAAVTLSTGDRWPVDQLVLLRRAGE